MEHLESAMMLSIYVNKKNNYYMGTCSVCNKYLGLLNREFSCCICGNTICRDCRNKVHNDDITELLVCVNAIHNFYSKWDGSFSV